MGFIIDIVIAAILILSVFIGYKQGLVKVIFNVCALLVAIIATFILYRPVSNFVIEKTEIDDKIRNTIIEKYGNTEIQSEENNEGILKLITQKLQEATIETTEKAVEVVAEEVSIRAVQIITGIGLFVVIRIALIILKFLSEGLAELPLVKELNGVGGIVYGLLRALVIIYLLLYLLFFVSSMNNNGKIQEAINESYITKYIYNNRIFKI